MPVYCVFAPPMIPRVRKYHNGFELNCRTKTGGSLNHIFMKSLKNFLAELMKRPEIADGLDDI